MALPRKTRNLSENRCMTGTVNIYICSEAVEKSDNDRPTAGEDSSFKKLNFAKSSGDIQASQGTFEKISEPVCTCPDTRDKDVNRDELCTCNKSKNSPRVERKRALQSINTDLCTCLCKSGDATVRNKNDKYKSATKKHKTKMRNPDGAEVKDKFSFFGKVKNKKNKGKEKCYPECTGKMK